MSRPWTSLDYLIRNELRNHLDVGSAGEDCERELEEEGNIYISSFVRSGVAARAAELVNESEGIKKLMNHKKLSKEVSESYGALVQLEKAARRLENLREEKRKEGTEKEEGECCDEEAKTSSLLSFSSLHRQASSSSSIVFFDVCCGKGITAFLLSIIFPKARIIMLDSNDKMNLEHLEHPSCGNISFQKVDIYSPALENFLAQFSCSSKTLQVVLGIHLCGHLSTRLQTVFSSSLCQPLSILILSPCCMPRKQSVKKRKVLADSSRLIQGNYQHYHSKVDKTLQGLYGSDPEKVLCFLKRNKWDSYIYWSLCMWSLLRSGGMRTNLMPDDNVMSEKNSYITILRE